MKKIMILLLLLLMTLPSQGVVSTRICEADGVTPFNGRDIVVGTNLTIIVWSDVNEYWGDGYNDGGSLAIEEAYWDYGVLPAAEPLPAAGDEAAVYVWFEPDINGFDLYTGSNHIEAGDWFIIDYTALNAGDCSVGFYDHRISWFDPIYYLTFSQILSPDFNNDTKVDFCDFAELAYYWQDTNCGDVNNCEGTDLNVDGNIDLDDIMLFCEYWLENTE